MSTPLPEGAESWAFGTSFEDPLDGVDTSVPDGVDREVLARYCLMLGDDALVAAHRLSQWASNAHDLEDDIALANIALDLLGQARLLLARAAAADPALVGRLTPTLPPGSPAPPEDALAYFRDAGAYTNLQLVEAENGDFAVTVVRLLLFAGFRLAQLERLALSRDTVLAAVATKGVKEVTYHRDYAGRWFVTLARGTEESRRRLLAGIDLVWPGRGELFAAHPVEAAAAAQGVGVDPADLRAEVEAVLVQVVRAGGLPGVSPAGSVAGETGRHGCHTPALTRLLDELQSVARAHPMGTW